jgi:glycosyltransferase involved in cell wall biosynthesis
VSVTVVIPTLNRAGSLQAALGSVAAQTLRPERVVVVDNASTDDTADVVGAAWRLTNLPLTYLRQDALVPMFDNWRTGIDRVETEWVKLLPDDDLLEPTCLERLVAASDGARVVQCAATLGGQTVYAEAAGSATDLAAAVASGRMSANPVTALLRTEDALASWDLFGLLSEPARASAFGPNLLLMYGAVLRDWNAHRQLPDPLVRIGGLDGQGDQRSYTLRVMETNHGLWASSYAETYDLLNRLAMKEPTWH